VIGSAVALAGLSERFAFGNGEANSDAHMDAVNLTTTCWVGGPCSGSGPRVQADLENGLFMGSNNTELANKGNSSDFVTALLKNIAQSPIVLLHADAIDDLTWTSVFTIDQSADLQETYLSAKYGTPPA
jgi:hypothetical protein